MKKIITFIVVGALMLSTNAAVFANSTTTSMSVGTTHTGLVKEDGQLVMWGMNEYGEFGIGKTSMFKQGFTDSEKDVVDVACGYFYSTAILKKDGSMWVCGRNNYGQLGNGKYGFTQISKEFVKLDTNVVKIGAGEGYFIYLKKDGSLWGVGSSDSGKLTNKYSGDYVTKPVKLMDGIRDFSTYYRNTAAINKNNELYMFGNNTNGQLGIGNNNESVNVNLPVKVLENVRTVSCGVDYVLAVKNDNTLYSWGKNDYCQLMNGKTAYDKDYVQVYKPTKVADNVLKACAGGDDSAYITIDNKLYMTGRSLYGQSGIDPVTYTIKEPRLVAEKVKDVAVKEHTIYTTLDGKTYTAGHNMNGSGDFYDGFMERPYTIAEEYEFSKLLDFNNKSYVVSKKIKQSIIVKTKKVKVKQKKLKKKKQIVKAITVKNAQGKVNYIKIKKGSSSKLSINKKSGKILIKKGTKKGTYKIKVKVVAAGNSKYESTYKVVTVKIKVNK